MRNSTTKFDFNLEGLPSEGNLFGYEDFRLDQPERGAFYVGIGDRKRVRLPERHHNRGHSNIASVHGVLRKVVKVFFSVEEMNAWEIARIRDIRESGATLVNKADGGEGTRGLMPCRNIVTGETKVLHVDQIPDGWVHSSTGMVPCRNISTGESTNFLKDAIPPGWETTSTGMMSFRNVSTGEVKRIVTEEIPAGCVGLNKGRATYKNNKTGETCMFDSNNVPEGWIHIFVGLVSCRNIETGETAVFPKNAIPEGWAGVTKGLIACKNPITGETGSFTKNMVPAGWVGMNSGNKKANGMDVLVLNIFNNSPGICRQELIALCVAEGLNKKSAQFTCWKLNLGQKFDLFDDNINVLKAFVLKFNRLPVATESFEGVLIGAWSFRQRQAFKQNKLTSHKILALESILGWKWN